MAGGTRVMGRLSIGAAGKKSGWVTVDANPNSGVDIVATIPPLPAEIRSQGWADVEIIHCIEHFFPWDAEALLRDVYAILFPGGLLVLEQPNILYAARVLAGVEPERPGYQPGQLDMWPLYGDPTHRDPLMLHKWGYSPESLIALLVSCGFRRFNITEKPAKHHVPFRDFRIEAVK